MEAHKINSGVSALDELIDGFRLGDNVVWKVDHLDRYRALAGAFADQALADGRRMVYVRFAKHPPVLAPRPGLIIESFTPEAGFDVFTAQVYRIISKWGRGAFYVFDNLSTLVDLWATDELLANFFQVTCPYLYELDTVAYFGLMRGAHSEDAVSRIRDTTQVLLEVFTLQDDTYVRAMKVWERHSPRMFLPHRMEDVERWYPVELEADPATQRLTRTTRAPWESVYDRLKALPADAPNDMKSAWCDELARMLLGTDEEIYRLSKHYLDLEDLLHVRERVIGSGRIGGKAAGVLLARKIVEKDCAPDAASFSVDSDDSYYIGSDVYYTFLIRNGLFRDRLTYRRSEWMAREEFEVLEQRFVAGQFEDALMDQFRALLENVGDQPLIVRSSSLLEDGYGNAFAGKYLSEFCVNTGPIAQRLESFALAVKRVYASTLNPDALSYRRRRGLLQSDEQMAVLVQRVDGERQGDLFYPALAGVAFSRNLYAWTDRIDPEAGMIRLVFGLGTRAVNRVSRDYPRMIAVSHPGLRPEIGDEVTKYSQHDVDVLHLTENRLATLRLQEVLRESHVPALHLLVSILKDGHLAESVGRRVPWNECAVSLTFNRLIRETPFVPAMRHMLEALEAAYRCPVDTEFTAGIDPSGNVCINLVQCRTMWVPGAQGAVRLPEALPAERVLFRAERFINGGRRRHIRYVLYVDPVAYDHLEDAEIRKGLPRLIGRINRHPDIRSGGIVMMGPGRWGSGNPELGIGVGYADIDHVTALIEVAREEAGHVPEVSYGTHFFQDLVEAEIIYMPVYPSRPESAFNEAFFASAKNALPTLLPEDARYARIVQVIDVRASTDAAGVCLVADPESRQAVAYVEEMAVE